jgi:hypothetical protein
MSKTVLLEEKTEERQRMPLRPVIAEPTEFTEEKVVGAISFQVILKGPSGIDTITTNTQRARFSIGPTWSIVATVNTFDVVPIEGSFDERLEQFKKKKKRESLTGHISHYFTEDRFPLEKKSKGPYTVHLVKFNKRVGSEEAISLLSGDKLWMRPSIFEELLDFGLNYPTVQEHHRVTALGSSAKMLQKSTGGGQVEVELVPALSCGKSRDIARRMLTVTPWRTIHPTGEMFLAVNKWP